MKRLFVLLGIGLVSLSAARAMDVKIEVTLATDKDGESPTTTFATDTPLLFALFKTKGILDGDKIRGVWIAEDVGNAAPKETKIDEKTLDAEGDTDDGVFSLSRPNIGWPVGKYRLEIYVGKKLITTQKFTIEAGAGKKDSKDE